MPCNLNDSFQGVKMVAALQRGWVGQWVGWVGHGESVGRWVVSSGGVW